MKLIVKSLVVLAILLVVVVLFFVVRFNIMFSVDKPDLSGVEVLNPVSTEVLEKNKQLVSDYYRSLYSKDYAQAINKNLAPAYKEHQTTAEYSKDGLAKYVAKRLADYSDHKVTIHRVIAEGNLVFLHVEEILDSNKSIARGELFRVDNSKIIEHWSSEQAVPETAANDNGMFSGPTPDLTKNTGVKYAKKAIIDGFEAWRNFDTDRVRASTTERYIQHNPQGKDGVESFVTVIKIFKVLYAITGSATETTTFRTISEGDFIVIQALSTSGSDHSNVFDLLRVTDDGRKDEHWDIIETVSADDIEKLF